MKSLIVFFVFLLTFISMVQAIENFEYQVITYKNSNLELRGVLYKPKGRGPFPAVLYNHGSAPGMLNDEASKILGPLYVKHGWIFFMPYRRGQGLSEKAGPYIIDEVKMAQKKGIKAASEKLIELLKSDHLSDQLAALARLKINPQVDSKKIAVAGNSFGGILTVLSSEKERFCASIDASGGSQSWSESPELRTLLIESAKNSKSPVFFFQAENDYDLSPSKVLSEEMEKKHLNSKMKIYTPFGSSAQDGHSFAYRGSDIWEKDVFEFLEANCKPLKPMTK